MSLVSVTKTTADGRMAWTKLVPQADLDHEALQAEAERHGWRVQVETVGQDFAN